MSTGIFPEKFAMYFANMNSLSGKIYSDVQAVEESLPGGLSYSEKCAVLDKSLIHDVLTTTTQKSRVAVSKNCNGNGSVNAVHGINKDPTTPPINPVWIDPDFDQDQLRSLLMAVHPKPPEKYVFEENGVWVDEHSQPFSFCKQSQVKGCGLSELIKNLPVGDKMTEDITRTTKSHQHGNKMNPKPVADDDYSESKVEDDNRESKISNTKVKKPKAAPSFFGVNVMGFMASENQNAASVKIPTGKSDPGKEKDENDCEEGDESNLPKQKQNLELIAELQAKLKKTNSGGKAGIGHVQPSKVSKPKAPPPPPPPVVNDGSTTDIVPNEGTTLQESEAPTPDKKLKQREKVEGKSATVEKEIKPSSKSPLLLHQNLKSNSGTTTGAVTSKEQEFCVDVSSPCRIATPKTGLDFLDNW